MSTLIAVAFPDPLDNGTLLTNAFAHKKLPLLSNLNINGQQL
jgi:hypothetical protein